ncbi:hypothetical protein PInf_022435 [Phytophthora infestans]|nr:hypothetical protein PInf_022435 [Phytophthora infestans]
MAACTSPESDEDARNEGEVFAARDVDLGQRRHGFVEICTLPMCEDLVDRDLRKFVHGGRQRGDGSLVMHQERFLTCIWVTTELSVEM